jgi:hypothetical protein
MYPATVAGRIYWIQGQDEIVIYNLYSSTLAIPARSSRFAMDGDEHTCPAKDNASLSYSSVMNSENPASDNNAQVKNPPKSPTASWLV